MNKFYKLIFTALFLLFSFLSRAQPVTYTSILTNPLGVTLDDPAFWQGGIPPPNPCIQCTILVYTSVLVPQQFQSTYPPDNLAPNTNHITLDNSILKLQGANTILTVNTYLSLTNGTKVFVGTDQSYNVAINLNDQVDMDANSSIQLGNNNTYINSNNPTGNPIVGPYDDFTNPGSPVAGIYSVFPNPPVGGVNYSYVLTPSGIGYNQTSPPPPTIQFQNYTFNCGGPGGCNVGFVNGPATTGADPTFGVIFAPSTTLPVQLVQFTASKANDVSVLLNWATSQEVNAGYYDVERSSNQSGWIKMGSVKAKGNSSTTTNYSYTDQLPLDGPGYYRLKMVDLDGKYTYSKIVSTNTTEDNPLPLVIYSNPFSDQIRLKVNVARAQNLTMKVSDIVGKTFISKSYQAQAGDNYVNLQPNTGGSGIYILHINGESYNQTVKLEKQ